MMVMTMLCYTNDDDDDDDADDDDDYHYDDDAAADDDDDNFDEHLLLPLLCHHNQVLSIWLNLPVACFRHFSVFPLFFSFIIFYSQQFHQKQFHVSASVSDFLSDSSPGGFTFHQLQNIAILMFFLSDFHFISL